MSIKSFELFQEKYNSSGAKLDYYYVLDDLSTTRLRDIYKVVNLNGFRAIATFAENIEYFDEIPCKKIALINYPRSGMTLSKIFREIEFVKADEVEIPWEKKYMDEREQWRSIVLKAISQGKIIRIMLEFGIYPNDYIVQVIDFCKEVGIKDIATSSGLIDKTTTVEKLSEVKNSIPNIFKVKVLGEVKDMDKAKSFFKEGAHIVGTSFTKINLSV